MTEQAKKLLIYHCGALGDFVLTWAGIHLLQKALPEHHFIGIGRKEYMSLAVSLGILDSFLDMESPSVFDLFSGKSVPKELKNIDGGVIYLADAEKIKSILSGKSTLPIISINPFTNGEIHVAQYYCSELKKHFAINIPENLTDCFPSRKLEGKCALLHPGSGSEKKNFSQRFYRNILGHLHGQYSDVKVVLGPVEVEKEYLAQYTGEKIETPKDVLALADLLKSALIYVGNDSGVTHLAAYLGIRTIALHKTTEPKIWGALGRDVTYIVSGRDEGITGIRFQTMLSHIINCSRSIGT